MGCVQSQDGKPRKLSREEEERAMLLAEQKRLAAERAAKQYHNKDHGPRRETDVLRRATAFDKLHEEAHKAPSLRDIQVVKGAQSQRLLEGFEAKEAEAHTKPELVTVQAADLKSSKLYDAIRGYEEKDEKAAQEPKLEKTFMEREKEKEEQSHHHLSDSIQLEDALMQSAHTDTNLIMDSKASRNLIEETTPSPNKDRMKTVRRKGRSFIKGPSMATASS